jgi:putative ABC transport system ATP-binding protein
MGSLIRLEHVSKHYVQGEIVTKALDDVSMTVKLGEILVILGSSGSGKTTLLNVISGLDTATSGTIYFDERDISHFSDYQMTQFRKENVGFIFQTYNLLAHLNVYENVQVGAQLGRKGLRGDIDAILKTVGLDEHRSKEMHQLSGGQQQRVAIARAIAKQPFVMFCDEPTGALDETTGKMVLDTLVAINKTYHTTMVIITHNPGIALIGDRIIRMNSGRIVEMGRNPQKLAPQAIPWG